MKSVIGKNLKSLRVANGYNQENVAEFMGINRSTYSNYESGDREAPLDVLEKAALLFGCDLSLFFEEDKNGYLHVCKGEGNIFRRQDAPKVYEYNGAIYIMNAEKLKTTHMHKMQKRVKYVMDDLSSFDLDTMWDWQMAESIIEQNKEW